MAGGIHNTLQLDALVMENKLGWKKIICQFQDFSSFQKGHYNFWISYFLIIFPSKILTSQSHTVSDGFGKIKD